MLAKGRLRSVPEGQRENSPAIHRGVAVARDRASPIGTTEAVISIVPTGLDACGDAWFPAINRGAILETSLPGRTYEETNLAGALDAGSFALPRASSRRIMATRSILMSTIDPTQAVIASVLSLPLDQRLVVFGAIQTSLADPGLDHGPEESVGEVSKAWRDEIARRLAELDSGAAEAVPAEEAERLMRGDG